MSEQTRAPDALDRLYAEARAEVDRLRVPEDKTTTAGLMVWLARFATERGLDMLHAAVSPVGTTQVHVQVYDYKDVGGALVAWARAIGAISFTAERRQFDYGGGTIRQFVPVEVTAEHEGVRLRVTASVDRLPRVVLPPVDGGSHTSPLCSLEPLSGSAVA